jgi:hypothetical protein
LNHPIAKLETKMGHLFQFIYMRVELWANQAIGNYLGNHLGNFIGAHREHDWNKGPKKKSKNQFPQTRVHAKSSIYKVYMLIIASLKCKQARTSIVDPTKPSLKQKDHVT